MRVKEIKIIKISVAWFKHQKIHNHHISINFVPSSSSSHGLGSGGYLLYFILLSGGYLLYFTLLFLQIHLIPNWRQT